MQKWDLAWKIYDETSLVPRPTSGRHFILQNNDETSAARACPVGESHMVEDEYHCNQKKIAFSNCNEKVIISRIGEKEMAKPIVFVIGASGQIGSATVQALSTRFSDKLDIRAGVRNPDKADKLKGFKGVTMVRAEMGVKGELLNTFKGVDALYIVTPPTENRAELTITTAEAAKEAGVKHILVVSICSVDNPKTVFGKQFTEIEVGISKLGVSYIILRLPGFLENFLSDKSTIQESSQFYFPVDPTKQILFIAVEDAGVASAVILADPEKHANKTYNIVSNRHSFGDVAAAFTEALGKEVKYVRVQYEDAKKSLLGAGMPQWQVGGMLDYLKLVDSGLEGADVPGNGDFERITGEKPTSLKEWVDKVKDTFK